jgi:hypothetical protein
VNVEQDGNMKPDEPGCGGAPPHIFRVRSHASLLQFPMADAGAPSKGALSHQSQRNADRTASVIDAIVVPTIRSAERLRSAVHLAVAARCKLIALYTDSFPPGLSSVLADLGDAAIPLALRPDAAHLLDRGLVLPPGYASSCALDISRKRNLGLLVGQACGWTRMLFLDDDIRSIDVGKLKSAASLLGKYPVVGLRVGKYPDASVIGHSLRMVDRKPPAFISGGSLLVDPRRLQGFFPPVYHEDWLCVIDHLRLGEVAVGDWVRQLRYSPFTTTQRAQLEEFGEVLAIGLLSIVRTSRDKNAIPAVDVEEHSAEARYDYWGRATKVAFWKEVLRQRAELLDNLAERLERACQAEMSPLRSIEAAQQRLTGFSPEDFVSFVEKWLASLEEWEIRRPRTRSAGSVSKALAELGLSHVIRAHEADCPESARIATDKPRRRHAHGRVTAIEPIRGGLGLTLLSVLLGQGRRLSRRARRPQ